MQRWCDIRKSIYIIQFLAISGKVEDTHTYDPEILLSVIDSREFQTYEQQQKMYRNAHSNVIKVKKMGNNTCIFQQVNG